MRPATCHPERPTHAGGECGRCYNRRYRAQYSAVRLRATGPRRVPVGWVVEHLRHLHRMATWSAIAQVAGVPLPTLYSIMQGRRKWVSVRVARALLATTESQVRSVGTVGVLRRVRALQALGWSQRGIAAAAGISAETVYRLSHKPRRYVRYSVAAAVRRAYERLHMTPGPSAQSRANALRRGWAPPLAWDDIDDPRETPQLLDGDVIDPVAVERAVTEALTGRRRTIRLTRAEQAAAIRAAVARGADTRSLERLGRISIVRRALKEETA